jgi:TonB family protein
VSKPEIPSSESDFAGLNPPAVTETLNLIRPWIDHLPPNQRRLGLFIAISLLFHLIAFFSLRIDTTRPDEVHSPHLEISLETTQADQYWDSLNDPRIFVSPTVPLADQIVRPSTFSPEAWKPDELPGPATNSELTMPEPTLPSVDQLARDSMEWDRLPIAYDPPPIRSAKETTWTWDDALAARQPSFLPSLPSPTSNVALVPTELRIAIDANGTVQHLLIESSCGKLDLDRLASKAAQRLRFQPAPDGKPALLWGRITIFWSFGPEPVEVATPIVPGSN